MKTLLITTIVGSLILLQSCSNSNGEDPGIDCTLSGLEIIVDSSSQPDCDTEGSISVSASGGTSPYTFSINGVDFQSSETFSGLAAGTYTLTVEDSDGCTNEEIFNLTAGPNGITLNVNSSNSDCLEDTGTITASASGGSDSFTFQIDGGASQSSGNFAGIAAGNHVVTVTDSEGCQAERAVFIESNTSLVADIMPIISNNCAITGCHNGSVSPNLTSSSAVISNAGRIRSETQSGSMPRGRTLSQSQIDLIACWVDSGAKNN